MDDFEKALGNVSSELKTLAGDINRIMAQKKKQLEDELKNQETQGKENAQTKKEDAKQQFQKMSLKSLQPVTKMYKDKKDIERANQNPEEDFIRKKLEDIFKNI